MKFKNIDMEKLVEFMKKHKLGEISLKKGRVSVKIKRGENNSNYYPDEKFGETPETEKGYGVETKSEHIPGKETRKGKYYEVKAPLVGTFYRAPAPDAEPFVEVGDNIKPGDTLCIVEAMKSMNNIESDVNGVVKEICVENAQLVEFGQVLIRIEEKK